MTPGSGSQQLSDTLHSSHYAYPESGAALLFPFFSPASLPYFWLGEAKGLLALLLGVPLL